MLKKCAIAPPLVALLLGLPVCAVAGSFYFPDMHPRVTQMESPAWLKGGASGDGYVSITSEIIPVGSCTRLSSSGFWSTEKDQLVLSVATNGFKTKLDKVDFPIATFDGRDSSAECTSLSTTPLPIVNLAVLGARSLLNPGRLSLTLNVKSSNDTQSDYVGSAKLLLGAATMVATGGTSAIVGGATAAVGNAVVSDAETRANKLMKGMTDAKVPVLLNWSELRNGVKTVEIPVYRADQSFGTVSDKKIQQLQSDPKAEKIHLFTVRLDFTYSRTLFYPAIDDIRDLGARENLSAERILNYPVPGSTLNFMQLLNSGVPSLLKTMSTATGPDFGRACAQGFEKLKGAGLNNLDIAIVMKSFIDEAKGGNVWYSDKDLVTSCFAQAPKIESFLTEVYDRPIEPPKEPTKPE